MTDDEAEPTFPTKLEAYNAGLHFGATSAERVERERIITWLKARALRISARCAFTNAPEYVVAFGLQQAAIALEAGEDP